MIIIIDCVDCVVTSPHSLWLQCSTLMLLDSAKDPLLFSVIHFKHPKQPHTVQVNVTTCNSYTTYNTASPLAAGESQSSCCGLIKTHIYIYHVYMYMYILFFLSFRIQMKRN